MPEIGEIKSAVDVGYKARYRVVWAACVDCGKERWVELVDSEPKYKHCNLCGNPGRLAEDNGMWKGGRFKSTDGYIKIRLYSGDFFYPMTNKGEYVLEHRLVVAKALKRCLLPWEMVHHKGSKYPLGSMENKQDNRYPENLELVRGNGRHNTQIDKMLNQLLQENKELKARLRRYEAQNEQAGAENLPGIQE